MGQYQEDLVAFNTMKLPILLALLIPLVASTELRVRLPPLPPAISKFKEMKAKHIARSLNNFRSNIIGPRAPTIPATTTATTSTSPPPAPTKKRNTGKRQLAVQSKKLV